MSTNEEELSIGIQGELLMASNNARLQSLAHKGLQLDMQQLMLRHLVETLFPTVEAREALNLSFQNMLCNVLDEAEHQADRIVLQANGQSSGLLVPGQ